MKAIVNFYHHINDEFEYFFPEKSIYSLPVVAKSIAEHLLERFVQQGVTEVLILDYNYSQELATKLNSGEQWGLNVEYRGCKKGESTNEILQKYSTFIGDDELIVLNTPMLLGVWNSDSLKANIAESQNGHCVIFRNQAGNELYLTENVYVIDSLKSYFELNFQILKEPQQWVIPGYSCENGIYLGSDVALFKNYSIEAPAVLADNLNIKDNCTLSNGVIIGNNVIVDCGCNLEHSIIFDNTYVGSNLSIVDKIIFSNRIIDVNSSEFIELSNDGIVDGIKKYKTSYKFVDFLEQFMGLMLGIIYLPFYGVSLILPARIKRGWNIVWSLAHYWRYFGVALGKYNIIACSEDKDYIYHYQESQSTHDYLNKTMIGDRYYEHNRNSRLLVSSTAKILIVHFLKARGVVSRG